jgi:hypothetical protein
MRARANRNSGQHIVGWKNSRLLSIDKGLPSRIEDLTQDKHTVRFALDFQLQRGVLP